MVRTSILSVHTFLPCHSVLRTFPGAGIVVFPLLPIGNFWKMEHAHRSGWIVDRCARNSRINYGPIVIELATAHIVLVTLRRWL